MATQVQAQFLSNQNKGIIWKLMGDNGFFKDIPEQKARDVKEEFDNKMAVIGSQIQSTDNITALNKHVINDMVSVLDIYKNANNAQTQQAPVKAHGKAPVDPLPIYNSTDIAQKRQAAFQSDLNNKQIEFEKFNTKPLPAKIDFSDKLDTPIGSEMDKILAEQIAWREKQLNMVLDIHDKPAANKWIFNGQAPPQAQQPGQAQQQASQQPGQAQQQASQQQASQQQASQPGQAQIMLKIGEPLTLEERDVIKPSSKKVNFIDTQQPNDFMLLLKKKNVIPDAPKTSSLDNDRILSLFEELLSKQDQILSILLKKIDI